MKKGLFVLVLVMFLAAMCLPSVANVFPQPPSISDGDFIDEFFDIVEDEDGIFINHYYCYAIKGQTVVNKVNSDKNFDYVMLYRFSVREDTYLEQKKYPDVYYFDVDGNGKLTPDEMLFDVEEDGWNGNEVDYDEFIFIRGTEPDEEYAI